MSEQSPSGRALALTAQIVAAHLRNNHVAAEAVPALIKSVYGTLSKIGSPGPEAELTAPAFPIKKSVFPDYIICLEDGKKLKMLKRHLATSYNMTPEEYRQKWGLPASYPMVAPNYAERRSALAKKIGLGRTPTAARKPAPAPAVVRRGKVKKIATA